MKKKLLSMGLVLAMTVSLFAGCGKGKEAEKAYKPNLPTASEEAEIFVKQIENLSPDFMKGMDVSSVIALEEAGVKYYNEKGEEEDLFKILADSGVNYIRVRVWNDPYDENGNGYGGGNCDIKKAAEIGKRAAQYGMKLLVDFHYSDFWADPAKQMCPKAWEGMFVQQKAEAIATFTEESLNTIFEAGANVGMVQIGNEINNGLAGEKNMQNICSLLSAASGAVRKVAEAKSTPIKVAVHYTQLDNPDMILRKASELQKNDVDYDVFGASYYTYWHGTIDNMKSVLSQVKEKYGKDVCILETSYCYTGEDGDQFGNSVAAEDCWEEYPVSVQGQATLMRDLMAAANEIGALGLFYWEGAWVPVGSDYEANKEKWEKYGAGWASSYAVSYDSKDAGQFYGGCSWDNQAFFDFSGKKMASLDVFKYVNYGATAELKPLKYMDANITIELNETLLMPEAVETLYNNPDEKTPSKVTWNADQVAAVKNDVLSEYKIEGTTEDGTTVYANIKVTSYNYVANSSFEDGEEPWTVTYPNGTECSDFQQKAGDATSGEFAYHFWTNLADVEFYLEQKISAADLMKTGEFLCTANFQGGDMGDNQDNYLYVKIGDKEYKSDAIILDGWTQWKKASIVIPDVNQTDDVIVGIHVKGANGGWGTVDDVEFCSMH